MAEQDEKREIDLSKLPRIYFNVYVAGMVRNRPEMEAINTDLLYFTLLLKMNMYAKEVYFQRKRKAPEEEVKAIYNHLQLIRKFILEMYEIPEPKWQMIQNEYEDDLAVLDSLKVEEDPWGDKQSLSSLSSNSAFVSSKEPQPSEKEKKEEQPEEAE